MLLLIIPRLLVLKTTLSLSRSFLPSSFFLSSCIAHLPILVYLISSHLSPSIPIHSANSPSLKGKRRLKNLPLTNYHVHYSSIPSFAPKSAFGESVLDPDSTRPDPSSKKYSSTDSGCTRVQPGTAKAYHYWLVSLMQVYIIIS